MVERPTVERIQGLTYKNYRPNIRSSVPRESFNVVIGRLLVRFRLAGKYLLFLKIIDMYK